MRSRSRRLAKQLVVTAATVVALVAPTTLTAQSQLITFDDLPTAGDMCDIWDVPSSYAGLRWTNVGYLRGGDGCMPANSGYATGTRSGPFVAFNYEENAVIFSRAAAFSWSGYFTGAWRNGLDVTVVGTLGGSTVYSDVFQVGTAGASFREYLESVDQVTVTASGGTQATGLTGTGTQFVFDDVTVSDVETAPAETTAPEPATMTLMASGLLAVGGALRFRHRRV